MTTETFELFGNDAKKYVELDPDIELDEGDSVVVELDHDKQSATWMIVPDGENPSNYVPQVDDYPAVVALLLEMGYDSPSLREARRAQLGLSRPSDVFVRATITIRADQKAVLISHPELNFSGWVQRKIDEELMMEEI